MKLPVALIFVIAFFFYALADLVWIGYIMKNYYVFWLAHLIRPMSQFAFSHGLSAVITWILIISGIYFFVIPRSIDQSSCNTFLCGALFGAILYGLYETTNYAVIYEWSFLMVLVDIMWGSFLCGVTTLLFCYLLRI